jgi:hypothetical protein
MSSLTIVPNTLSLSATGQLGYFLAIGTSGTTGLQEDVTDSPQLAWTSSNPTIATVCTQAVGSVPANCPTTPGAVSGVSAGTSTITAEFTNTAATSTSPAVVVTGTGTVAVTNTPAAEPLLSIVVTPESALTDNLEGSAQFLAFGTFSTAPTVLDVTNGFFHAGFPNASCTAAFAAADANTVASDAATETPVTNLPFPECSFVPVNWVSLPFPFNFPISSAGAAGATGGLITAEASGTEQVYAVASNPDSTLVYGTAGGTSGFATFNCPYTPPTYATITTTIGTVTTTTINPSDILNIGTCNSLTIDNSLLSTLTVFNATLTSTGLDQANWLITAPSATSTPSAPLNVIHCGGTTQQESAGGSVCEATYPNGTTVILTAPTEPGVNFGGWSDTCTPCTLSGNTCTAITTAPFYTATGPNYCSVVVGGTCTNNTQTDTTTCTQSNVSVGAIFN